MLSLALRVLALALLAMASACCRTPPPAAQIQPFGESWYTPQERNSDSTLPELSSLATRYHSCISYRDRGTIVVRHWDGKVRTSSVSTFETTFVRTAAFKLLLFDETGNLHAGVLQRGGKTQTWVRGKISEEPDLATADGALRGVSFGLSTIVPSVLGGSDLSKKPLDLVSRGLPECISCLVTSSGTQADGRQRVFWLDHGVLRRTESIQLFGQQTNHTTTTFQSDVIIAYHNVEFDSDPERLATDVRNFEWPADARQ